MKAKYGIEWVRHNVLKYLETSKHNVFLRKDFTGLGEGTPAQINYILANFVYNRRLMKIGVGIYARTSKQGKYEDPVPINPLPELGCEALTRLGFKVVPTKADIAYKEGKSTQVPTGRMIGIIGKTTRRIGYNGKYIYIESHNNGRRKSASLN